MLGVTGGMEVQDPLSSPSTPLILQRWGEVPASIEYKSFNSLLALLRHRHDRFVGVLDNFIRIEIWSSQLAFIILSWITASVFAFLFACSLVFVYFLAFGWNRIMIV
jgi:hypothetical protein